MTLRLDGAGGDEGKGDPERSLVQETKGLAIASERAIETLSLNYIKSISNEVYPVSSCSSTSASSFLLLAKERKVSTNKETN